MERHIITRQKKRTLPIASLLAEIDQHLHTPPEEYPSLSSNPPIHVTLLGDPAPSRDFAFFQGISALARNSTDVISQLRSTHLYPEYRESIDNTSEFRVDTNAEETPYLEQCRLNMPSNHLSSMLRNINLEVMHETSREFDRLQTEASQRVSAYNGGCSIDALLAKYSAQPSQVLPPADSAQEEKYYDIDVPGRGVNQLDMELEYRRTYAICAKKLVPRAAKQFNTIRTVILNNCKRVASQCAKETRRQAQRSHKLSRESVARARRLMREANAYWRRYERVERESRRKAEREALEQRRMEEERREAKRQQRKLNFLITQTELYAHFVSGKKSARLKSESAVEGVDGDRRTERDILSRLEETAGRSADPVDTYNPDVAKETVLQAVRGALGRDQERQKLCDSALHEAASVKSSETAVQPDLFQGELKSYQLKGMRWLAGLYSQGINGILADEMGLGKTIQTLALLAHLAEREKIWGPFLVVAPASTLHNWQQECERFVPAFKVLPYWGNAQDRRTIRQYMNKTDLLSCSDSPFHILVTSYQLAVRDCSYLHKITWQYMVLDEAQAIKSSASQRWQVLLGFKCRNRLLLTGTPIQNSMAELWALLHFIMPSLFDSHDEFNEWFSKDIESHAEGKSAALDQDQLSRLHLILKPFMLRRIKKDVEHEMAAKIEINLECELTLRQKLLYQGLKNKLSLDEIFQQCSLSRGSTATSLLNIVMQFRKVCNHPDLFDRREVTSPLVYESREYFMPRLLYHYSAQEDRFSLYKRDLVNIHSPRNLHYSLQESPSDGIFGALASLGLSSSQWHTLWVGSHLDKLRILRIFHFRLLLLCHYQTWLTRSHSTHLLLPYLVLQNGIESIETPHDLPSLVFTNIKSVIGLSSRPLTGKLEPTISPRIIALQTSQRIISSQVRLYASTRRAELERIQCQAGGPVEMRRFILRGLLEPNKFNFEPLSSDSEPDGLYSVRPLSGWSGITVPTKEKLITDSGKMRVLDRLLARLKADEHRVLIYSQMTKVIDLLEEFMMHRKHTYIRLDGSSRISERRDMVADFQTKSTIFAFLLSTRAGGLGINLTAADTVIFYDSDWNPTVDQQAMDRAHRLGQTKQVTVYRLITKGTIDEKILERAREKSEIQHMVISGGQFKMDALKPKDIASLLLDSEDIENKLLAKQEERRQQEERMKERKRKSKQSYSAVKRFKPETSSSQPNSRPSSPSVRTASPSLKQKGGKPPIVSLKNSVPVIPGDSREHSDTSLPLLTETMSLQDFNSDTNL